MKPFAKTVAVPILAILMLPAVLAAREVPPKHYSGPIGLTESDALRIVIAPAPIRVDGAAAVCRAVATVEILDALDMRVLATFGPHTIEPGASFVADFTAKAGAPPMRQEVVVSATVERVPQRRAERGSLDTICPLLGSFQIYDRTGGTTLAVGNLGGQDLTWQIDEAESS